MIIGIDIRNIGKNRTGDEAVFFNLTQKFARIDSENEYRLFTDIVSREILEKIELSLEISQKSNVQVVSLPTANRFAWNFWVLQAYLRKNPVDIYLTQYITPFFVPRKIKIVTIIHDISFNFYPKFVKFSDWFFLKTLIPLSLRRADKIIGVSNFTAEEILKYYKVDRKKVGWIHNAVSEEFIQKARSLTPEEIKKIKEKYNLPEKYILYLGTFQPRKNLLTLIEAFALIKEQIDTVKLVLAGGKGHNFDRKIGEMIEKNRLEGDVFFPGFIDETDKPAVFSGALVFCFPSFYEGFGIPILEAMESGVPAVVSDIAPHREIAESAAVFFNPSVAGELALNLAQMLKSEVERNNLAVEGKLQAQKFSWLKTAINLLEIFKSLN
jgi:glycosyltransferase involved in cell wall biosynthesis